MRRRTIQLLGFWGASAILAAASLGAVGCSEDDLGGSSDDALTLAANRTKNNVLTDQELLGTGNALVPDAKMIQRLFERTPHNGVRSVLADRKVTIEDGAGSGGDVLVSDAIANAAKAGGINPLELVVRLQMEQGLIGKATGQISEGDLARKMQYAMGCGCPHAPVCQTEPEKYTGFYKQLSCAVRVIKGHMDDARRNQRTSTGWALGVAKATEDESEVTPENAATAVLYTYTPYAGEDFGGQPSPACKNAQGEADFCSGNALHTWLWDRYADSMKTASAMDAGVSREASVLPPVNHDATVPPVPTDSAPPPPVGGCFNDQECLSNPNGLQCFTTTFTCGCTSQTDCTGAKTCDQTTSKCIDPVTPPPPDPPPDPPPAEGDSGAFPLFDSGVKPPDEAHNATPPPATTRPADNPAARPPAPNGGINYSTDNPYGDGTSKADGGKKKAAPEKSGCNVGGTRSNGEVPDFALVAFGALAVLAKRRRR